MQTENHLGCRHDAVSALLRDACSRGLLPDPESWQERARKKKLAERQSRGARSRRPSIDGHFYCQNCHEPKPNEKLVGNRKCADCHNRQAAHAADVKRRNCRGCGEQKLSRRGKRCFDCVEAAATKRANARGAAYWASAEGRRETRRRAAERSGKVFIAGKPWLSGKNQQRHLTEDQKYQRSLDEHERQRAIKARAAAKRANTILLKPWCDPKLSQAERFRLRYRHDPIFNLKERLKASFKRKRQGIKLDQLLRDAINRNGESPKAESFLGYSVSQLKVHMERQFSGSMSWKAFCSGDIHIDHILPLSSFDLSNVDELRIAWALPNLRPLWAADNLVKGSKRVYLI